jgi:hypothetical protein
MYTIWQPWSQLWPTKKRENFDAERDVNRKAQVLPIKEASDFFSSEPSAEHLFFFRTAKRVFFKSEERPMRSQRQHVNNGKLFNSFFLIGNYRQWFITSRVARFFLVQNTKRRKNIPNNHKITRVVVKCTKWQLNIPIGYKMFRHFPSQGPTKYAQIGIFWLLATLIPSGDSKVREKNVFLFCRRKGNLRRPKNFVSQTILGKSLIVQSSF